MTGTRYEEIYVAFLSKVEDEYLASLDEQKLHIALYPLLLSAINDFARIAEHNLRSRNESGCAFNDVLSEDEIEVLAVLMKPCWLERYMNTSRKIEQQYYDAGIKTYSPNENLRNLTNMYQQYLADARKAKTEYTYKRVSVVGNFHGVGKAPKKETVYNETDRGITQDKPHIPEPYEETNNFEENNTPTEPDDSFTA